MNNPIRKFRKFFVKPKKMNATAVRNAAASSYDEETDDTKLSGAFIIVLILHIVAVVGIVAFTRIKENRKANEPAVAATPQKDKKAPVSPMTVAGIGSSKAALPGSEPAETEAPLVENNPPKVIPSTGGLVHTVKANETLTKIAMAYGTTVPELVKLNDLKSAGDINIGQHLNLPDKNSLPPVPPVAERRSDVKTAPPKPPVAPTHKTTTPAKSSTATYVVKKGDNPVAIARQAGVSYEEFVKLNNIKDPKKIQPGQVLKIPKK